VLQCEIVEVTDRYAYINIPHNNKHEIQTNIPEGEEKRSALRWQVQEGRMRDERGNKSARAVFFIVSAAITTAAYKRILQLLVHFGSILYRRQSDNN
jgi:hypothetical protein